MFPVLAAAVARLVASGLSRKQATKVAKDQIRKLSEQPAKGQMEMFKGSAGPNVIRPTGRPKQGVYTRRKQLDLFDKVGNNKLTFKPFND